MDAKPLWLYNKRIQVGMEVIFRSRTFTIHTE